MSVFRFSLCEADLNDIDDLDVEDPNDLESEDLHLNTVQDSSQVSSANQFAVLKKKASDYAEKYLDLVQQMSELGKKLNITVKYDNDLNILTKKLDGSKSDVDSDVTKLKAELEDEEEPQDTYDYDYDVVEENTESGSYTPDLNNIRELSDDEIDDEM